MKMMSDEKTIQGMPVKDFMRLMDVADLQRRQSDSARTQLDMEGSRDLIKQKLRETYSRMGADDVTETQLDSAVNDYFNKRWEFQPPEDGFRRKLSMAYIKRGWICKRIVLPIAIGGAAIAGAAFGIGAWTKALNKSLEAEVENSIEKRYAERENLDSELKQALASADTSGLLFSDSEHVKNLCNDGLARLAETDSFFEKYAPAGRPVDAVTQENFSYARKELESLVSKKLEVARSDLSQSKGVFEDHRNLGAMKAHLDSLIKQVRDSNPPPAALEKGERLYLEGTGHIGSRSLANAKEDESGLMSLLSDIGAFGELKSESERLYKAIADVAAEDEARKKAEALHIQTASYISSFDIPQLREIISQLSGLQSVLEQQFDVNLVKNTSRYRVGQDRHNSGAIKYYLIVEARDSQGNSVPQRITNQEDGSVVERCMVWGEEIPKEVYDRLAGDFKDDRIVNDSNVPKGITNIHYAAKKRGYLSLDMVMTDNGGNKLARKGQITRGFEK